MAWAPAVGLLLGVIASAVLFLTDHPLGAGPLTASGLAVGSLALLTRGLHLDGLADLADGLASGKPAPAALDIMRRSDIGPLGVVTLVLTLLLQVAALSQAESAGHGRGPATLIAAVVTGRLALTWACRRGVPAARPDGLGALVAGSVRPVIPATATAVRASISTPVGAWVRTFASIRKPGSVSSIPIFTPTLVSGTSFATGLPALAMITSSPASARSTSLDNSVFA